MKIFYSFIFVFILMMPTLKAQDDLLDILNTEVEEEIDYTTATFKSSRVINMHTNERTKKRQLDFRVNHRFGQLNSGAYELWGLDHAVINFLFEYGITDWWAIGVRRGTADKTYDGSMKFTILRQSKGRRVMPVSVSFLSDVAYKTIKQTDPTIDDSNIHRLAYAEQLIIARKFNERFSIVVSPTFIHRNRVDWDEENDTYAVGLGGRIKLTRRIAFTYEYFWASSVSKLDRYHYPLAFGIDLETGGHVFQLFLTNSQQMVETAFIPQSEGNWLDGGIYIGFNISRAFAIGIGKGSHRAH